MPKNGNGNDKGLTRADIDRLAYLESQVKRLSEQAAELKDRARGAYGANVTVEGFAFVLEIGETPEIKGKVDYRAELVRALKSEEKVAAMEALAAKKTKPGTPRVSLKPNPACVGNPELLEKSQQALAAI